MFKRICGGLIFSLLVINSVLADSISFKPQAWKDDGTQTTLRSSTENVGIGSSTPGKKLDVNGTVRATSFIGDGSGLTGLSTFSSMHQDGNGNIGINTASPQANLTVKQTGTTDPLHVASAASTSLFKVTNGGNVGIGSSAPGSILDVNGTVRANAFTTNGSGSSYLQLTKNASPGTPSTGFGNAYANTDGSFHFVNDAGTDTNLTSNSIWTGPNPTYLTSGNVGIGTATPSSQLVIYNGTGTLQSTVTGNSVSGRVLQVEQTDGNVSLRSYGSSFSDTFLGNSMTGGNALISAINATNGLFAIGNSGNKDMILGTNNLERMRIDKNGNIGIGNSGPFNATLAVNGNAVIGSSYVNSGAFGNGLQVQGNVGIGTQTFSGALVVSTINGNVGIGSYYPAQTLDVVGTVRISSLTVGQALCSKSDKSIGQCTTVVGAGGGCTCS